MLQWMQKIHFEIWTLSEVILRLAVSVCCTNGSLSNTIHPENCCIYCRMFLLSEKLLLYRRLAVAVVAT